MHPAEISTYLAEKRAGVYDNDETLGESATVTAHVLAYGTTLAAAVEDAKARYGNAAEHWEQHDHYGKHSHIFTITPPEDFSEMTEDQARDYLKDTYPDMPADQWEIEQ